MATIVNIACDIAQQQIATPEDIDRAVTLGLGYPTGPLALGDALGATRILEVLKNIERVTGDQRYRPSLWLQRRVQLGMSLLEPAAAMGSASARARKHGSMQRGARARAERTSALSRLTPMASGACPRKSMVSPILQARRCRRKLGLLKSIRSQLGLVPAP